MVSRTCHLLYFRGSEQRSSWTDCYSWRDFGGWYLARDSAIWRERGLRAVSVTYQEALANVEVIIKEWIETAQELGRPMPQPKGRLVFD